MKSNKNSAHEILLVNPPSFIEGTLNTQPIPLGLIFLNRYLRLYGYQSYILNLSDCQSWDSVCSRFENGLTPRIIGITSYTRQRFSTLGLASLLKKMFPSCIVCLGGPHATFLDEPILHYNHDVDYIIRGEGEDTFFELVEHYYNDNLMDCRSDIEGLSFLDEDSHYVRTNDRAKIKKLAELPLPLQTREELGNVLFSDSLRFHFPNNTDEKFTMAPIICSRGCNGNCTFCCNKTFWGNNRCTSALYAYKQFEYYYKMGIRCFDIYDDNFTSNPKLVSQLCKLIIQNDLDIHWWCSSRVDSVSKKMLFEMKQAGCFMISFGVESGSQQILDNIGKGVNVSTVVTACELARGVGLSFRMTISIGHLGETISTVDETISLINYLQPTQIAIFILKVYPGTPIAEIMKEKHLLSDEFWFDKSKENVPLFTCEHSPEKLLHFRNRIIERINATIVHRYEDELYSVELDLIWR